MRRALAHRRALGPLTVLGLWIAFALGVQRWASWDDGIRELFSSDVRAFEIIARAAPDFPSTHLLRAYAERFPVHWLVGELSTVTGMRLHAVYRFADAAILAGVIAAVHLALRTVGLGTREYAVAIGVIVASAYPVHYLLAAPGMLSDGLFVLGLAVLVLGFVRESLWLVLAGMVLATLGRQSAIPVALIAAGWAALLPAWREVRWRYAAAVLIVPAALYGLLHLLADRFTQPRPAGVAELTVWGYIIDPPSLVGHVGRITIGVLVPVALIVALWLRTRRPLPRGPLLIAVSVIAQPLVLGPLSNEGNEPRLAGLAVPALAVAAGILLSNTRLTRAETLVAVLAVGLGGLHPRYTNLGQYHSAVWVALETIAALALVVVIGRTWPLKRPTLSAGIKTTC